MPAPVINVSLTLKYIKEEINRYQEMLIYMGKLGFFLTI